MHVIKFDEWEFTPKSLKKTYYNNNIITLICDQNLQKVLEKPSKIIPLTSC